MNILLIAHERNLGGASKSLATLAEELKLEGHKVIVIVPFKKGQLFAKLQELKIPTYHIFFGWWMMPSYWKFPFKSAFRVLYMLENLIVYRIIRVAKNEDIQIIHSNSSVIDIGARAAKKMGIPHVWHFREFGDADYQLEYLKGRDKSCRIINSTNGKVVFISQDLKDYYKHDIKEERGQVIYNGIAESFLIEKNFQRQREKIIFLISGNMHRNKRQNLALDAAKILMEKGYTNFELWIAGQVADTSDSREYVKELNTFIEKNKGLEKYCKILGYISDMKKLRSETDVELVCSKKEGFGRVTVEAMMASNPVIGSASGATLELVKEGENGYLFEEGNAENLASKMELFLEQPQLIEDLGKKAYRFARKNFLSELNTKKIEQLYGTLIKEKI